MDLTTLVEGKTHKKSILDSQGIKNYSRHINNLCKDSRLNEALVKHQEAIKMGSFTNASMLQESIKINL